LYERSLDKTLFVLRTIAVQRTSTIQLKRFTALPPKAKNLEKNKSILGVPGAFAVRVQVHRQNVSPKKLSSFPCAFRLHPISSAFI